MNPVRGKLAGLPHLLSIAMLASPFFSPGGTPNKETSGDDGSFGETQGPHAWGERSPDGSSCSDNRMPYPIALSSDGTVRVAESLSLRQNDDVHIGTVSARHNGHTVVLDVAAWTTLSLNGEDFELEQLHFHAASEHTLDGERYPLEMHFVHRNDEDDIAVLGVLVERGEKNAGLAELTRGLPMTRGEKVVLDRTRLLEKPLLPPADASFHYSGSMTTGACSERVEWLVMRSPVQMDADQLHWFDVAIGRGHRPLQARHARAASSGELRH